MTRLSPERRAELREWAASDSFIWRETQENAHELLACVDAAESRIAELEEQVGMLDHAQSDAAELADALAVMGVRMAKLEAALTEIAEPDYNKNATTIAREALERK